MFHSFRHPHSRASRRRPRRFGKSGALLDGGCTPNCPVVLLQACSRAFAAAGSIAAIVIVCAAAVFWVQRSWDSARVIPTREGHLLGITPGTGRKRNRLWVVVDVLGELDDLDRRIEERLEAE